MKKLNLKNTIYSMAVISLLIFLHATKISAPVEGVVIRVLNPLLNRLYSAGSKMRIAYNEQADKRDLASVNNQLKEQLNSLVEENVRLKVLEDENNTLRSYLKFLTNKENHYAMANVISRGDVESLNQALIIDKGNKDGLYPGLAIVSSDGNIVGKITEVKDHVSEFCLVTSNRCQFASTIMNKDKTIGISQGDLGLTIQMNFIPQNEEIKVGDMIITSGLEKSIPRGLIIGQVRQVIKENNELWQNAKIESLSDLDDLVMVSVLLP